MGGSASRDRPSGAAARQTAYQADQDEKRRSKQLPGTRAEREKKRRKKAKQGGIKSRDLEQLTHPLDRSFIGVFLLTIFFTALALASGIPVVLTLFCLIPFGWVASRLFSCDCLVLTSKDSTSGSDQSHPHSAHQSHKHTSRNPNFTVKNGAKRLSITVQPPGPPSLWDRLLFRGRHHRGPFTSCTKSSSTSSAGCDTTTGSSSSLPELYTEAMSATDVYWLGHGGVAQGQAGVGVSHAVLFADAGLGVEQLRDIVLTRVLSRPELARFRYVVGRCGCSRTPYWKCLLLPANPHSTPRHHHYIQNQSKQCATHCSHPTPTNAAHPQNQSNNSNSNSSSNIYHSGSKTETNSNKDKDGKQRSQTQPQTVQSQSNPTSGSGGADQKSGSRPASRQPSKTSKISSVDPPSQTSISSGTLPNPVIQMQTTPSTEPVPIILSGGKPTKSDSGTASSLSGLAGASSRQRRKFDKNFFHITDHVFTDQAIGSKRALRERLANLSRTGFQARGKPMWEIRHCAAPYTTGKVILILRVHQALTDGVSLLSVLVQYLCDSGIGQAGASPIPQHIPLIQGPGPTYSGPATSVSPLGHSLGANFMKPRFGGTNLPLNILRAVLVGPLSFTLWLLWAWTRRSYNFLRPHPQDRLFAHRKSIYWTSFELPRLWRIKQVSRGALNDVIMTAMSGALRMYLREVEGVDHPPDLNASIAVDIRPPVPPNAYRPSHSSSSSAHKPQGTGSKSVHTQNGHHTGSDGDSGHSGMGYVLNPPGVEYVLVTSPLPCNTEGSIPRLWEIRHLMEELKSSADPTVMWGAHYFIHNLLPNWLGRWLLNLIHRNSSLLVSNLQGPDQMLTIGSHRVHKILYWMCPPGEGASTIPVTVNVISYGNRVHVCLAANARLVSNAKRLAKILRAQVLMLSQLLSRRRVPGEGRAKRRKPSHVVPIMSGGLAPGGALSAGVGGYLSPDNRADRLTTSSLSIHMGPGYGQEEYAAGQRSPGMGLAGYTTPLVSSQYGLSEAPTPGGGGRMTGDGGAKSSPTMSHYALSTTDLSQRLHAVQTELYSLSDAIDEATATGTPIDAELTQRLEELKEEFTDLMMTMRRRKSIAEQAMYHPNVVINVEDDYDEDDDLDIELEGALRRPTRRFSAISGVTGRRTSIMSLTPFSTGSGGERGGGGSGMGDIGRGMTTGTASGLSGLERMAGASPQPGPSGLGRSASPAVLPRRPYPLMSPEPPSSPERGYGTDTETQV